MSENVNKYLDPVLQSGYIGEGKQSALFEKRFGEYIGNPNTVVVNSGTSAIVLALKLAGVGHGDYVISTPATCLATNMAILSVGAKIVWADVNKNGNVNVEDVAKKILNSRYPIKAIVCVDWGGMPCDFDELNGLTIPVIEDACHSIGSYYKNHHVGIDSDFTCFSFQAIKNLTTGDGGALVMRDSVNVDKVKMMRWFGLDRNKGASMRCTQDPPVLGYKMQLNDIAASIGLANLGTLTDRLELSYRHACMYNDAFDIWEKDDRSSSYWLYTINVEDVTKFIQYMKDNDVECSPVHDRNDTKTIFKEFKCDLPGVDYFDDHHVCIPVGWWLTDDDVKRIIQLCQNY
jgi:dTDP-4-amino-4,6-dideoxygalactose transaminase